MRCPGERIDVDYLTFDPDNARLHPEENDAAIRDSLSRYGQLKPLVVRRDGMTVVAGNGTLAAARGLGWRELACNVVDLDQLEAVGYGLADNRTSELAAWDVEVVSRLSAFMAESEQTPVGWTADQVAVLRANVEPYSPIQGTAEGDAAAEQTWQDVWKGMPEFVQEDLTAARRVTVNFKSEEDFLKLCELTGQNPSQVVNNAMWYPPVAYTSHADKRFVSADGDDDPVIEDGDDPADDPVEE